MSVAFREHTRRTREGVLRILACLALAMFLTACVHAPPPVEVPVTVPIDLRHKYEVFSHEADRLARLAVIAYGIGHHDRSSRLSEMASRFRSCLVILEVGEDCLP